MKKLFIVCIGLIALAWGAFAQTPTMTPATSPGAPSPSLTSAAPTPTPTMPAATATAAASMTPVLSPTATASEPSSLADKIHRKFDKKLHHNKGIVIDSDDESGDTNSHHHEDVMPADVLPIIAVVMTSIFGMPVLIMAVILYFGFSRNRMMHRTVRMMVEKGQPVPAALLSPPPAVRKRSDMRRGVVLCMIGLGMMIFFAAVNDGEGGAWAIGVIPFLIGAGYLFVWKLEGRGDEAKADNPPPLP
jgi:hypothetical protein